MDLQYQPTISSNISEISLAETQNGHNTDDNLNKLTRRATPFPSSISSKMDLTDLIDSEDISSLGAISTDEATIHAYSISEDIQIEEDIDIYTKIKEPSIDTDVDMPATWAGYREYDTDQQSTTGRKRALSYAKSLLSKRRLISETMTDQVTPHAHKDDHIPISPTTTATNDVKADDRNIWRRTRRAAVKIFTKKFPRRSSRNVDDYSEIQVQQI